MLKKYLLYVYDYLLDTFCKLLPTKQQIYVDNFGGRGFGDNPKYIINEVLQRSLPYKIVWQVNQYDKTMPPAIKQVKKDTLRARCELFMSKVRIDNIKNGFTYRKKRNQYYIQTWHGYYGFKPVEKEIENQLPRHYVRQSIADSASTDIFISANSFSTEMIKTAFWKTSDSIILESGAPRNDIYFNITQAQARTIKQALNIDISAKILVYAPTFRDTKDGDVYNVDFELIHKTLEQKFNNKWIVVIRLHPNAISFSQSIEYNDHIINGSLIADAQELFAVSDALITDYSSVIGDFIIMNKPVFLYVPDLDEYIRDNRDLRPLFFKQPFALCKSIDVLLTEIYNFDNDSYLQSLNKFMNEFCVNYDDGLASYRVVSEIEKMMEDKY